MVAAVVVVFDEAPNAGLEITRQEVVFEQDPVFEGLMPTLDLTLGLWVVRRTADVIHAGDIAESW